MAALEDAPGGAFDVLVPADRWRAAFRQLPKGASLGLSAGAGVVTLALPESTACCPVLEGRWPDVDAVLPKAGPLVRVRLNPRLLARLLELAAACGDGDAPEAPAVDLLWYGRGRPLGLMCKNREGQTFDALLMPLDGGPEPPRTPEPAAGDGGGPGDAPPTPAADPAAQPQPGRNGRVRPPLAASR